MNKSEFMKELARELNCSTRNAHSMTDTILNEMIDTLGKGDNIEIRGFGSFKIKEYASYTGRNPKTGELIKVKSKKLPFFKVGKELAAMVDS